MQKLIIEKLLKHIKKKIEIFSQLRQLGGMRVEKKRSKNAQEGTNKEKADQIFPEKEKHSIILICDASTACKVKEESKTTND